MKTWISILGAVAALLLAGKVMGSDLDDEYNGEWNYTCVASNNGRPTFTKDMRADSRDEAETKVWGWVRKQTPPRKVDAVECHCSGEAGCK